MEDNKRCVITGLGMISSIGNNVEECFNNAIKGVSGIEVTKSVDTENCYANLASEVKDYSYDKIKEFDGLDRVSKFAVIASREALSDAKLGDNFDKRRASVIMGSCVGGAVSIEHYIKNDKEKDDILRMPISAIGNDVARFAGFGGVVTNVANACAAGTISIAYACDLIKAGKADVVIAGGTDAFASVPYAGFLALHALDQNPCSPFNHCTGITLGEGAGALVVESLEHAKKRGAKVYAEVSGYGISSDAHHITAPREDGEGQMNAINWAIERSGVKKNDIGYINAHGTGTAKNDNAEFLSLHTIFDGENDDLSVSSTKAMVGHCLGAAGAIEAVFSIKCLTNNLVLPTLRYTDEDLVNLKEKALKIDFVPNKYHEKELNTVMSNSFAFGGNNASIIFSKKENEGEKLENKKPIAITGIGAVTPLGNSLDDVINVIKENKKFDPTLRSKVTVDDYNEVGLKMAFYRKLDNLSQLQAVSGMKALKDRGLVVDDDNATSIGIVEGSSEGALGTCLLFEENIAEKGNSNGSAFNFPNTVYNAAGGYLSICSGIKGYNVTITNGFQSGLQSVAYGMNILRNGIEKSILSTGTDEAIDIIKEAYSKLDLITDEYNHAFSGKEKFNLSDGSTSLLIENENIENPYAYLRGYGMAHEDALFGHVKGTNKGLEDAIKNALDDAGMSISDIDLVSGFAEGVKDVDDIEKDVYQKLFNEVDLIEIKDYFGEGRSATASLSLAVSALLLNGKIGEIHGYNLKNNDVKEKLINAKNVKNILVTSYAAGGSYTAIIVSKER